LPDPGWLTPSVAVYFLKIDFILLVVVQQVDDDDGYGRARQMKGRNIRNGLAGQL
jgi:hypothetical protein